VNRHHGSFLMFRFYEYVCDESILEVQALDVSKTCSLIDMCPLSVEAQISFFCLWPMSCESQNYQGFINSLVRPYSGNIHVVVSHCSQHSVLEGCSIVARNIRAWGGCVEGSKYWWGTWPIFYNCLLRGLFQ
jgi:hypothetical protein